MNPLTFNICLLQLIFHAKVFSIKIFGQIPPRVCTLVLFIRIAKCELGEKMIVWGRAATWWDEQIKSRIYIRWEVYKKIVNGR